MNTLDRDLVVYRRDKSLCHNEYQVLLGPRIKIFMLKWNSVHLFVAITLPFPLFHSL